MKIKLTLFAAVIVVAIASSAAIASRDTPVTPNTKPVGMSCCAAAPKVSAPAIAAEKETPVENDMSCHSAPAETKGYGK